MEDLLSPYIGNPNIKRQAARARLLAQQREAENLPDPRTYGFVKGLLGTSPDELGMSVLSPNTAKAKESAYYGYQLGNLLDAMPAIASVSKPAAKLVGAAVNDAMVYGSGPLAKITPQPMSVYRPSTPLKPDPTVGSRYEREFMGGLAEKTPVKLEDYKGASIMLMPWDSTSRNYKITGISDEPLLNPVITHGGQDYSRDLAHINEGIAGASNLGIAKRIKDRDAQARIENIMAGGTGEVIHLPTTMGAGSENFSVMPTEALLNFVDRAGLSKSEISDIDSSIKNFKVAKGTGEDRKISMPFKDFKGIMSEEGRIQLYTGEGLQGTQGDLRKAVVDRLTLKNMQERLGFNAEDLSAALTDEALLGVPKGYVGNTVIMTTPEGMHLRPSRNKTYNTDFTGEYQGSLGVNVPADILFRSQFESLGQEFAGKKGDIRNMILGALEKRKEGVSAMIDDRMIEDYYKYLADQKSKGLLD